MPDASSPDPDVKPQATSLTSVSGGVNIDAQHVSIGGDLVAGGKTVIGYSVKDVEALLDKISSTFQPKPFDGRCPYLGLDAFSEEDADRFFGRETLVKELVARVKESRFVVIAGPSGSGKSSLVRAGLIHALKQGAVPNSDRWMYATLTPGRDPIEALALAMSRMAKSPEAGKYLREHSTEPNALHEFVESQLSDRKDQRAVIFVDQFEEVFTQVSKEDGRLAFLNLLTNAATRENGRVTVLFALRSDFVSNCATYPQLNALLNQQFMQVGAMQPDELVSAIARPALQVGLRIDPDLVAQIVNDMQDEPGALPLMEFALKDLFDAQQTKGGIIALTLDDYLARGGLQKALERHANAAFATWNTSEQQIARHVFSSLIQVKPGMPDTGRTATFGELVPAGTYASSVETVIQQLANARLVTTDEVGGQQMVTLAHEKLIDAWPWLRKLVDENREIIALQNRIAEDAKEWEAHQRNESYLYVGARLRNVREQMALKRIVLTGSTQTFVEAGLQAEETARQYEESRREKELEDAHRLAEAERLRAEEQARSAAKLRQRAVYLASALVVALLAIGVALFFNDQSNQNAGSAQRNAATAQAASTLAVSNASIAQAASTNTASEANSRATAEANALSQRDEARRQAQVALSRQLAAQALSYLDNHLDVALLMSVEADRVADTTEARGALLNGLQQNPRLESYLRGHTNRVLSVAFSPDGKTLASCSWDNTIRLWDVSNLRTPKALGEPLTSRDNVASVAFSPDGKTLASGGSMIRLWDVSNPQTPKVLGESLTGHTDNVQSVAFSPDGKTLASGSYDKTIRLWDVSNPRTPKALGEPLTGNTGAVESVAFSPNGKMLASGSNDQTIRLWDVSNPQAPKALGPLTKHTNFTFNVSVAFSPDGKTLASGGYDGMIRLWDVSNPQAPKALGVPLTDHASHVYSVAFSPDGKTLAASSYDRTIHLWDVSNPRTPKALGVPLTGHTGAVESVAFSPDSKTLASGSQDNTILLWDVSNPQPSKALGMPPTESAVFLYNSVAFSPDGKTLASSGCRGFSTPSNCKQDEINLWDVSNPQAPQTLGEPLTSGIGLYSVAFSPDSKTLASAGADNTIRLWDVSNLQAPQALGVPLAGHTDAVESVAFSPDGKTLASGSDDQTILLWDVSNPRAPQALGKALTSGTGFVYSVAFSPDGKTLASAGADDTIRLWDVSNPQTPQALGEPLTSGTGFVYSVAFSPDGKTLASAGADGTIRLWDVSNLQAPQALRVPLAGHTSIVFNVAFSPDGKTLASGGVDNTIRLWDVSNLQAPQALGKPLTGHTDIVDSVAFSPDGKTLASGSADKTIILWDVDTSSWRVRACQIVGRNFTRAEWQQHMGDEPYRKTCKQWPEGE